MIFKVVASVSTGQDISQIQQETLRANISMVTQDTSLLHRSVRDNILYGRQDASEQDMLKAAKQAQTHEFVQTLSDLQGRTGYDAHVGERGGETLRRPTSAYCYCSGYVKRRADLNFR